MKKVDTTLTSEEKSLLAALVGKRFDKYRCDEFLFRPAVYQSVALLVEGRAFEIESRERTIDYFGTQEDVSCVSFHSIAALPKCSRIEGQSQVDTPMGEFIQDIVLVEDVETMSDGEEDLYEFSCTRAIVFVLPNRKVVFEKDVWLSEDINIYRGPHAEEKIMPADADMAESDRFEFQVERKTTSLANPLVK